MPELEWGQGVGGVKRNCWFITVSQWLYLLRAETQGVLCTLHLTN